MLTHDNFLCQVRDIHDVARLDKGDIWLSVLLYGTPLKG